MQSKTQIPTHGIENTLRKEPFTVSNLTDIRNLPAEITEARIKITHHNDITYKFFKRHENGGGFKQDSARVAPNACIQPSGLAIDNAIVEDKVVVANFSTVGGNSKVSGEVIVGRYSTITGNADVSGDLEILATQIDGDIKLSGSGSIHRANLERFNSE